MRRSAKAAIGGVLAVAALGIGAGAAVGLGPPAQAAEPAPRVCTASPGAVVLLDGSSTPRGNTRAELYFCVSL